ncbi:MAG: hypothetical protein M4579_004477 [Chaenotheca gracillima]|nr:MAG: hypothetical protein M4579_004477 [Chaenotheca gracillima]
MIGQNSSVLANFTALQNDPTTSWVSEPDTRGTAGVLYSCVFTIYLCVWSAIHPNIPSVFSFRKRKFLSLLEALFAPELILYLAFEQRVSAKALQKRLNECALLHKREPNFSLKYAFYVVMGAFHISFDCGFMPFAKAEDDNGSSKEDDEEKTKNRWKITPKGVIHLAEQGIFLEFSDEDIEDKSKSDAFAKVLVCIQVVWTFISITSRAIVGYPISLLELHTIVHVTSAVGMYIIWFNKPVGVRVPTQVTSEEIDQEFRRFCTVAKRLEEPDIAFLDLLKPVRGIEFHKFRVYRHFVGSQREVRKKIFFGMFVSLCFSGIHLMAWNFMFPSFAERVVWRISAFGSLLFPWFLSLSVLSCPKLSDIFRSFPRISKAMDDFYRFAAAVYLMAGYVCWPFRLYIVIESFISLRNAPSGIYVSVPWSEYFPHF